MMRDHIDRGRRGKGKREREGIRAVGREGGRREKNKKEARASVRRS